jgi:hypothetical protein
MVNDTIRHVFENVYFDPRNPGSFGTKKKILASKEVSKLQKTENLKESIRHELDQWLEGNRTYTLHKLLPRKFHRQKMVSLGPGFQIQCDLADMQRLAGANQNIKYLLNIIDIFTKKADSLPLKNKKPEAVVQALRFSLDRGQVWGWHGQNGGGFGFGQRNPRYMYTDSGGEFCNKLMKIFLQKRGIIHVIARGDHKAAVVEKFNFTIKRRIYALLTASNSLRYIHKLKDIVYAYNHSYHTSIGMRPIDVGMHNLEIIRQRLYGKGDAYAVNERNPLNVGDYVRVSKLKSVFSPKSYLPQQTEEIFQIVKRDAPAPTGLPREIQERQGGPFLYILKDSTGSLIKGRFYAKQLVRVQQPTEFLVEKILQKRKNPVNGRVQYLVRFQGYTKEADRWLNANQLRRLK